MFHTLQNVDVLFNIYQMNAQNTLASKNLNVEIYIFYYISEHKLQIHLEYRYSQELRL